jgi:ribosomal protein S12 methylthiotransferase accessory factor
VGELAPAAGASAALTRLGTSWVAHELALWRAGDRSVEGRVLTIASGREGPELVVHTLVRRPQCPACGDGGAALRSRSPRLALDPPARPETAEATLRRLESHVSPVTGLVASLRDVAADEEDVVHAYVARHPFALGPDTLRWRRRQLRFHAYGKGATDAQARVSAIGEAIERHCGSFHADVPRTRSTYEALSDRAVHPATCLNFSADQYARRDELNAHSGFFEMVPRPFPEALEIDWVALWSLTHERVRHLPAALCYLGHPDVEEHFYCAGDPNGCAAGTTLPEAVLHAFLEVVERDSAAIWWYNRVPRPAVDLGAFGDPYLRRVEDWHRRHGRELWALDISADLGVPVFVAVSRRVDGPTEDLLFAFGADLDPGRAIVRAVAEVNQFLPAVSGRTSDGATRYAWPDEHAVRFWRSETLATQPQLAPAAAASPGPKLPPVDGDVSQRLAACVRLAREHGLELLALDQTLPDAGLHVARVVVPGLRHFWRRLAPGRLYDVPVALGWLEQPTPEAGLNPASVFY